MQSLFAGRTRQLPEMQRSCARPGAPEPPPVGWTPPSATALRGGAGTTAGLAGRTPPSAAAPRSSAGTAAGVPPAAGGATRPDRRVRREASAVTTAINWITSPPCAAVQPSDGGGRSVETGDVTGAPHRDGTEALANIGRRHRRHRDVTPGSETAGGTSRRPGLHRHRDSDLDRVRVRASAFGPLGATTKARTATRVDRARPQ